MNTVRHFTCKTIIKHTYIKKQRVVDSQRQLYVAKMTRAVAEVLHASCTGFFGIWRSQRQVVQPVDRRIAHTIQVLRICYGFHAQLPEDERKGQKSAGVNSQTSSALIWAVALTFSTWVKFFSDKNIFLRARWAHNRDLCMVNHIVWVQLLIKQ